jgi:biopolymer transport protein ExbB/TolQ
LLLLMAMLRGRIIASVMGVMREMLMMLMSLAVIVIIILLLLLRLTKQTRASRRNVRINADITVSFRARHRLMLMLVVQAIVGHRRSRGKIIPVVVVRHNITDAAGRVVRSCMRMLLKGLSCLWLLWLLLLLILRNATENIPRDIPRRLRETAQAAMMIVAA